MFLNKNTAPHIFTLIFMSSMSVLSMSVFLPSLPSMTEFFKTDYSLVQLSVSLYLACTAVVQLIAGPLSDYFGRRNIVLAALILLILATIGCYFAQTIEAFLFFRVLQASIATLMAISRAIVRDMATPEKAASMLGYVTMGMSVAPMIAPSIGGFFETYYNWQATFLFVIILSIGLFLLCWFDLGETNKVKNKSLREQIKEYPILFSSRRFWGYAFAAAFSTGTFFAFLGGAPFVGSKVFNLAPTTMGFLFGLPALGFFFGNFATARFSMRVGIDKMILLGTLFQIFGMGMSLVISLLGFGTAITFFGFCIFIGIGNGLTLANSTAGMLSIRPAVAGTASGIGGSIQIGGGAALAAIAGFLLTISESAYPLQIIMFLSAFMGFVCIVYVIRRAQIVGDISI
ncbi:MAG: Bcr/CflA family drug resistance efflux transporter [Rhodobacteraceae bacterium]|nr:Bcr/CflA family drug resistance efflux transporter [Paracoccaceae bacterium]MBV04294.1 Bcr/CflA family drug resistance efflux transporter [Paracoccaceae bacterium]MDG1879379.1 multidrug effflux MFS transporter [Paracoccaceae bacterium]MDG1940080.1 multidrug effflux MFS transporter [Paracoccaceae bacterium]